MNHVYWDGKKKYRIYKIGRYGVSIWPLKLFKAIKFQYQGTDIDGITMFPISIKEIF